MNIFRCHCRSIRRDQFPLCSLLTFPNEPFPSTIKKLKSVERIMSFLDMLWGKSRSTDVIFFVIDVFCRLFMQIEDEILCRISQSMK